MHEHWLTGTTFTQTCVAMLLLAQIDVAIGETNLVINLQDTSPCLLQIKVFGVCWKFFFLIPLTCQSAVEIRTIFRQFEDKNCLTTWHTGDTINGFFITAAANAIILISHSDLNTLPICFNNKTPFIAKCIHRTHT